MKKEQEILKIINNNFIKEIGLDWLGFESKSFDINETHSFFMYRESKEFNKKDVIHFVFGWEGSLEKKENPFISENHFQTWVLFEDVSTILYHILDKPEYEYSLYGTFLGEFGMTVSDLPNYDKNQQWLVPTKNKLSLYKEGGIQMDNLRKTSEIIFEYLKTYHLPFFERVSSLQVVNDEIIDKVPKEEYGNYIPGRFMNAKVLIIMKLCKNTRYSEYRDWALGAYSKGVDINPDRYLEDFNIIKSLVDYLDSGKYMGVV